MYRTATLYGRCTAVVARLGAGFWCTDGACSLVYHGFTVGGVRSVQQVCTAGLSWTYGQGSQSDTVWYSLSIIHGSTTVYSRCTAGKQCTEGQQSVQLRRPGTATVYSRCTAGVQRVSNGGVPGSVRRCTAGLYGRVYCTEVYSRCTEIYSYGLLLQAASVTAVPNTPDLSRSGLIGTYSRD